MNIGSIIALFVILFVAFIPTMVAYLRGHVNTLPIFLTNLFFSWTGIGWLITLIWACNSSVKPKTFDSRVDAAYHRAKDRERRAMDDFNKSDY